MVPKPLQKSAEEVALKLPEQERGDLSLWLQRALEETSISQAELARRLTQDLGRNFDKAAVNKMVSAFRRIAADELLAIERITRISAPKEIQVPLLGRIGTGGEIFALSGNDVKMVEAPAEANRNSVALEVSGDSMHPVYEEGTLLFYSESVAPAALVDRRCVLQLTDNRMFVRVLRRGGSDDVWTLQSVNPFSADIHNATLGRAYKIDWIRPR